MSGISNRTIFVDGDRGYLIFHDWARVSTAVGSCYEPRPMLGFGVDSRTATSHLADPSDDIQRVDAIESRSIGKEKFEDGLSGQQLVGGQLWKRAGY